MYDNVSYLCRSKDIHFGSVSSSNISNAYGGSHRQAWSWWTRAGVLTGRLWMQPLQEKHKLQQFEVYQINFHLHIRGSIEDGLGMPIRFWHAVDRNARDLWPRLDRLGPPQQRSPSVRLAEHAQACPCADCGCNNATPSEKKTKNTNFNNLRCYLLLYQINFHLHIRGSIEDGLAMPIRFWHAVHFTAMPEIYDDIWPGVSQVSETWPTWPPRAMYDNVTYLCRSLCPVGDG